MLLNIEIFYKYKFNLMTQIISSVRILAAKKKLVTQLKQEKWQHLSIKQNIY